MTIFIQIMWSFECVQLVVICQSSDGFLFFRKTNATSSNLKHFEMFSKKDCLEHDAREAKITGRVLHRAWILCIFFNNAEFVTTHIEIPFQRVLYSIHLWHINVL